MEDAAVEKEEDDGNLQEKCRSPKRRTRTYILRETHVNISQGTSEEPLYAEIFRKNAAAQIDPRARTYFARACADEMHFNISQGAAEESFFRKFTGKIPLPRLSPERGHTFCASLRNRNTLQHCTRDIRRATVYGNWWEKRHRPE